MSQALLEGDVFGESQAPREGIDVGPRVDAPEAPQFKVQHPALQDLECDELLVLPAPVLLAPDQGLQGVAPLPSLVGHGPPEHPCFPPTVDRLGVPKAHEDRDRDTQH